MRTPTSGPLIVALVVVLAGTVLFATTSVTVAPGDTLSDIATEHGVSTAELVDWNDLDDPDRIFAGDVLVLAVPTAEAAGDEPVRHVVSAGDTLSRIAARYGASVAAIAEANALSDPDLIRVGQRLTIGSAPDVSSSAEDTAARPDDRHTVAPGETLFAIASRYDRTIAALVAANDLADPDRIRAGDVLIIPARASAAPEPEPEQEADPEPEPEPDPEPEPEPEPEPGPDESASPDDAEVAPPSTPTSAAELDEAFDRWALNYGVDQSLLEALTWHASDWQPNSTGPGERLGIARLTPGQIELIETRLLGLELDPFGTSDGVRLAARYLRYVQDRTHNERDAVAAFRQGLTSFLDDGATAEATDFADNVLAIRDQRS